mmetsp:Transcript_27864/g.73501  ORF Transcript_27864/g.73501 Transcript_27864/m.73501 type:complete len:484 (+) Transcript_27864:109-1560(+)
MSFLLTSKPKQASQGENGTTPGVVGPAVKLDDHTNTVFCCAFSDHSTSSDVDLATASYDSTTRIWDVSKALAGNRKSQCKYVLKGNLGGVWCCAYSPRSEWLVSGCSKGSLAVYAAARKYQKLNTVPNAHGSSAIFTASIGKDDILATGGGDNNLKLWKINGSNESTPLAPVHTLSSHSGDVVSCAFRPQSSFVASGSQDRHIRVWDITTFDCVQTLIGHTDEVCSCSYNSTGTVLASASSDKGVRLWDARMKNRPIQELKLHKSSVYSVVFNRGGSYELLASASQDCTVALWDPRNWRCCQVVRHHAGEVVGLAFHPQSLALATGSADMTIGLHPLRTAPPTDADYALAESARPEDQKLWASPGGGDGPKKGSPKASPMFMEVPSDVGVSPITGPTPYTGPNITTMPSSSRALLAASASHRNAASKVSPEVRKELEDELAQQVQLLGMAMRELERSNGHVPPPADPADVEDLRRRLTAFYNK